MDLLIPFIIIGIISLAFIAMIPSLVVHTIGQLLLSRVDDYEGWCYYGSLLEKRGHTIQAYNAYKKSIEINPTYAKAQERLADLTMKMEGGRNTSNLPYSMDQDF